MAEDTPNRRWYRKTRWAAAWFLTLLAPPLFLLAEGPAFYAVGRGWVTKRAVHSLYSPAAVLVRTLPRSFVETVIVAEESYLGRWYELGRRHAGSD